MRHVVLSVRVPPELKEQFLREAEQREMNLSQWMRVRLGRSVLISRENWATLKEKVKAEKRATPLSTVSPQSLALGCLRRGMKRL